MLVDLAGSERASASSGKSHLRAEEAKAINLSLSALGNCMSALAAQSSQVMSFLNFVVMRYVFAQMRVLSHFHP